MATQNLIPGVGFVNETSTTQGLIPGAGFVNETVPNVFTYTGTGGAVSGGAATVCKAKAYTPSGGAVGAGTATTSFESAGGGTSTFTYVGSGGAVSDGTADVCKAKAYTPTGGAVSGGTAAYLFRDTTPVEFPYDGSGGAVSGGGGFYEFLSSIQQGSGGYGWSNLYTVELARLARKRAKFKEEEEAIQEALEAMGVELPQAVTDGAVEDVKRLRGLVVAYAKQDVDIAHKTQRAIDYAQKARTQLAYELAVREIARELEDDEHALLLAVALL